MKIKAYIATTALFFVFGISGLSGAVDQTFVERIIKENREFIDFIDVSVTNFAPDKKNDLFEIYQKHFNGEVAFLQGDYKRAFDYIYDSQKDMVVLYEYLITEHYMEDSKNILDGFAADIIRSKNVAAKHYLTLGYRDRTLCRNYYISGEAAYPKLYSLKIFRYLEGINMARRGKRYAFISLYTGQTPQTKLRIFNQMFKSENEKGGVFFNRFVDKNEKEYIAEMEKTYDEYEKELEQGTKTATAEDKGTSSVAYEKRMARAARFRKEKRVARYLINGEFDKAETIIREYVGDYNFKLIQATFVALETGDTHQKEGDAPISSKKDYKAFLKHHNDNYKIYNEKSVLESVIGNVKVVDAVKKNDNKMNEPSKIEGNNGNTSGDELNKKIEDAAKEGNDGNKQ